MKTTNTINTRMAMTCADVASLANVSHAQAQEEAFKLIAALHGHARVAEGIDWEWDAENDSFSMTAAIGCVLVERLNPVIHYGMTRQRLLVEEEAYA